MGYEEFGNLSHSASLDFLSAFMDNPSVKALDRALDLTRPEHRDDRLFAETQAIVAAEIVSLLNGHPHGEFFDRFRTILEWAEGAQDDLFPDTVATAETVTGQIMSDSQFKTFLEEEYEPAYVTRWIGWQKDLVRRLGKPNRPLV